MGKALSALYERQPMFTVLGVGLVLAVPVLVLVSLVDTRMLDGASIWLKPIKFSLSLGLYLLTLAFFVPWMREGAKETVTFKVVVWLVSLAIVFEFVWLYSASALGIRSHFNDDGGLYTILYPISGLFAITLVWGALMMGISVLRGKKDAPNKAFATAIGWGLVLTFVLTMIAATGLTDPYGPYGGSKNGYGEGLFGWRVPGGDLRAAHFFATRALHIIPLVMFPVSRIFPGASGAMLARITAAAFSVMVVMLTLGTYQGQDLPALLVWPF